MDTSVQGLIANSIKRVGAINANVRRRMEIIIKLCHKRGICVIFTQGMRSMENQAKLYGQGRSNYHYNGVDYSQPSNPIVTNANPGKSVHNYGLAIDFAIVNESKEIIWDTKADFNQNGIPDWIEVVTEAKKLGFNWGGDWKTFQDFSHLEWIGNLTYNQIFNGEKPKFPSLIKKESTNDYYQSEKGKYKTLKTCYVFSGLVFSRSQKLKILKKGLTINAVDVIKSSKSYRLKIIVDGNVGYVSSKKTIVEKIPDSKYHTVVSGETLTGIAAKYKTTIDQIVKLNKDIKNIDLIYVGQKIRVL
ncbi:M15 family metallopeptidase [Rummeliibacillus pycnus]|uniref:M15 family metallopeptidase n=1 Tax=Rummeliibacillus pycnus TaxID=101070 RepID=UPI003D2DC057